MTPLKHPPKKPLKPIPIGKTVIWTGNRGKSYRGRVDGTDLKSNGPWVAVNIAPKGKNRQIIRVQQTRLTVVSAV